MTVWDRRWEREPRYYASVLLTLNRDTNRQRKFHSKFTFLFIELIEYISAFDGISITGILEHFEL